MDSISDTAGTNGDLKRARRRRAASTEAVRTDRLPPHSPEAEQGVLGCILIAPNDCLEACMARLRHGVETFYDLRHQELYKTLMTMRRSLIPIDIITVQQHLKDRQLLDEIGGIPYLNELENSAMSPANLSYWLTIVEEKFVLRKMIQTCTDCVGRIYESEGEVAVLMDQLERDVLAIRGFDKAKEVVGVKELVGEAIGQIEKMFESQGKIGGLSTGFIDLDKYTDGLHGGDMVVLAANTSVGKSSFAMNVAEHVLLHQHKPVGVFTLEMTAMQLVMRFLCSHARVNLRNVREGFLTEADFPKLTSAAGKISNAAIYFDDSSDLSIYQLRANARKMKQAHDIQLFIVDYLQLLNASGGSRRIENRQQEVADISNGIKQMAKELNVPVLALSQLNDEGKLRESRAIGMDTDGLWHLERVGDNRDGEDRDGEAIQLWVRKNRNGPRDVCVHLTFLGPYTRFESAAKVADEDVPYSRSQHSNE